MSQQVTNQTSSEKLDIGAIKRRSVRGAGSYFLRTMILQAIGLVAIFVLSAFFTPEDFAIYGIVAMIIGLLTFFSDIGLAAALIQQPTQPTTRDMRTVFTIQQLLSWLIVGVCLLLIWSDVLTAKIGTAGNWVFFSLALSFPLASLKTIPSIILERELKFDKLVIPQIVEQFFYQGILIGLAWKGLGVLAYAYAIMVRSLIGVVIMYSLQRWPIGLAFARDSFFKLFKFGVSFQLNDFLARIKDNLFYLVLGMWMPLKEFGYVQWAKNWSMYPYNLTVQNVMAITFPTYSRLQSEKVYLQKAIEATLFFITLIIFPMLVLMCLLVFPFIEVFPVYAKWQPALWSLVFFTLSIGWSAFSTPLTNTLNAIGKISQTLKLMILWTILTWILTPLFVIWLGYVGVSIAALVIGFTSILSVYMLHKHLPVRVWDSLWRQLLASAILILVGLPFVKSGWLSQSIGQFLIGAIGLSLLYLFLMWAIARDRVKFELNRIIVASRKT